jgi:hypothetical protein
VDVIARRGQDGSAQSAPTCYSRFVPTVHTIRRSQTAQKHRLYCTGGVFLSALKDAGILSEHKNTVCIAQVVFFLCPRTAPGAYTVDIAGETGQPHPNPVTCQNYVNFIDATRRLCYTLTGLTSLSLMLHGIVETAVYQNRDNGAARKLQCKSPFVRKEWPGGYHTHACRR